MAKSKSKRKKKGRGRRETGQSDIDWGAAAARPSDRLWTLVLAAGAVAAVAVGGYLWWQGAQVEEELLALAARGKDALAKVETPRNLGTGHLGAGEFYNYESAYPTSGRHARTWTKPGVHERQPPANQLVHALEHGNIVVYYDAPGAEAQDMIEDWAGLYGGQWDGLVAVRQFGLGRTVVLTAWTKRLRLQTFDPAAAAAFVDAYRGRGPENPVR